MFKFIKKDFPLNFNLLFQENRSVRYNLRVNTQSHFRLPKNTCKYIEHSLAYRGPKLWNSIPGELKKASTVRIFKGLLKNYLLYT